MSEQPNENDEFANSQEFAETNPKKKSKKTGKKPKKREVASTDTSKPKRSPQVHTNKHIRGMLESLLADRPGCTFTQILEEALCMLCDGIAAKPAIQLARLDAETLRIQGGIAATTEDSAKRTIRAIIKARLSPATQARLTQMLEEDVMRFRELRRTMMRQAAIPISANLPEDVSLGIKILEQKKLESADAALQNSLDNCIQILKAYRPPELDLPQDLRDPLA